MSAGATRTSPRPLVNITFLGHGNVGLPLADRLHRCGHAVTLATRAGSDTSHLVALARNPGLVIAAAAAAVASAEVVFLATPYSANAALLPPLARVLAGKILVDCTNPVGPDLTHGLASRQSGSAAIQTLVPLAHVVKAFSIYGFENLEDNSFPAANVRPAMLLCGDHPAAKTAVSRLIDQLGWFPLDVGGLEQALHLEHMTLLWIRYVRMGGHSPHLVWAALQR
jgi:8-hydroxy-5-deazaflavin:NADPH oxidoreductase